MRRSGSGSSGLAAVASLTTCCFASSSSSFQSPLLCATNLQRHQRRAFSWSSLNPFGKRETARPVEAELPEIFAEQPQEIDDYIRPERSMFEKLEDWWEYLATFMDPVEKNVGMMKYLKDDGLLGMPLGSWGVVFLFYGFCVRSLSLIPSLYAHRNSLRMQQINGPLNELSNKEKLLKNDKSLSSQERRVVQDGYKRMKKALYKKYDCAQWKSGAAAISTPFLISCFMAIRRLAVYEEDLERASFLWVSDLTMPDPTYLLPLICSAFFVLNFELNQSMTRGGRSNSSLYLRWVLRGGCFVFAYMASSQPSALFVYWIGMSCAGLIQPLLLRYQPFRDYFKFPDPPAAARGSIGQIPQIKLQQGFLQRMFGKKLSDDEKKKMRDEYEAEQQRLKQKSFQRASDVDIVFDDAVDAHGAPIAGSTSTNAGSAAPLAAVKKA